MNAVRFAILGLGTGAMYGLSAQGLVLIHRASGVVNLAQGAMGMFGAFVYYELRSWDWPAGPSLVLALACGAAVGGLTHLVVMRSLNRAPAVWRVIATIAVFTVLVAVATSWWDGYAPPVSRLLPVASIDLPDGSRIGVDRVVILLIGVLLSALLMGVYRWTGFGRLSAAQAEDPLIVASVGRRPDVIATVNWAIGGMLAVGAAILIAHVAGLDVIDLSLLVVPALAAALVGRYQSFALAMLGGIGIGVAESVVGRYIPMAGFSKSLPFLVIILVLVVGGSSSPGRGDPGSDAETHVRLTRRRTAVIATVAVLVLGVVLGSSDAVADSLITTFTVAIVVLSLVVVTGMAGQLSLAQLTLAGVGALVAARLVAGAALPLELAFVAGVLCAVPVGVAVGLPALRTRGVSLAVVTLGLAFMIEQWVFLNADRAQGIDVGTARLFGVDVDPASHPWRYVGVASVVFLVAALLVVNLRRSPAGRQLLAVRSNERVASSLGVNVVVAKLSAFGIGAAIAAAGGVVIAFRNPIVVLLPQFSAVSSIYVVLFGVIGGLGSIPGALGSGSVAPGGLLAGTLSVITPSLSDFISGSPIWRALVALVAVVATGLRVRRQRTQRRAHPVRPHVETAPGQESRTATPSGEVVLEVDGVTVRFGSVTAVDQVAFDVRGGEIVGIVGSNGAGKTTLMDCISGFQPALEGEVRLRRRPITRWSPSARARAGIGRTFQAPELFASMSMRENLLMAIEPRSWPRMLRDLVWPRPSDFEAAHLALIEAFGFADALDRRPDELSLGARRVAGVLRAILRRPEVLLLDEPAAGLTPAQAEAMMDIVVRTARAAGVGVVIVEHDHALVLQSCDRIVVLDAGRVIADVPPREVRRIGSEIDLARLPLTESTAPPSVQERSILDVPGPSRTAFSTAGAASGGREDSRPVLGLEDLSGGYGGQAIFEGIDLVVRRGEVVSLVGANGSGKSTLLQTIAGLLPPIHGDVTIEGVAPGASFDRRVRGGLAFLGERRPLTGSLSTRDNLLLGGGSVAGALAIFPELEPLLTRRAGDLSGGEQYMVVLGRALASEPSVVVIDELSLGLSPVIVDRLTVRLREAAGRGAGVLCVEQNVDHAIRLGDRVSVLRGGRLVLDQPIAWAERSRVVAAVGGD